MADKVLSRFEDMESNVELTTRLVRALALRHRLATEWVICVRHLGNHIKENRMDDMRHLFEITQTYVWTCVQRADLKRQTQQFVRAG